MKNDGPEPVSPDREAFHEQRVPLHDCDPLGIVWHGNYYKYLEIARTALFETYGLTVPWFREHGIRLVMMETRCRHAYPLRLGETLRVRAWFKDVEQRLHVAYEVRNLDQDRRSARAWTTLVATDTSGADETLLMETPDAILRKLAQP